MILERGCSTSSSTSSISDPSSISGRLTKFICDSESSKSVAFLYEGTSIGSKGLAIQSEQFFACKVGHFTLVEVKEGNKEG